MTNLMKVLPTILIIIMSSVSCSSQNYKDDDALIFLNKFDFVDQFIENSKPFAPLFHLDKENLNKSISEFQNKYSSEAIKAKLVQFIKETFSKEELSKMKDLDADAIVDLDKEKFKSFEKKIEKLFDDQYIEGNRLLSGIEITGIPNQSRPFEFFTVNKPNGLYIASAFDSYLPQNVQISQEPLIKGSDFLSSRTSESESQQIFIELDPKDQNTIIKHFSNLQKEPLALIINKRIINIISDTPKINNNILVIYSPWSKDKLQMFSDSINKKH